MAITSAISQCGYSISHNGNNICHHITKVAFHLPHWQQHLPIIQLWMSHHNGNTICHRIKTTLANICHHNRHTVIWQLHLPIKITKNIIEINILQTPSKVFVLQSKTFSIHLMKPCLMDWQKVVIIEKLFCYREIELIDIIKQTRNLHLFISRLTFCNIRP